MTRFKTPALTLSAALVAICPTVSADTPQDPPVDIQRQNPLIQEWDTPYSVPPFDRIQDTDYAPALEAAFEKQRARMAAIAASPEPPDFENTILAIELARAEMNRIYKVFDNITATDTDPELDALELEIKPRYARERDAIYLDQDLYQRVQAVHARVDDLDLGPEQKRLVELTHRDFVRAGTALPEADREHLKELNASIARLSARFGQNLRTETKAFALVIEDPSDLSGLPPDVISAARESARKRGYEDAWVFGLDRSSFEAFMANADNRELRRRMFDGYRYRGAHGGKTDNREILVEMARLRAQRAELMGYRTHADYQIEVNMAKTPERAEEFLLQVWEPGLDRAREELADMRVVAEKDGVEDFQGWDWWYYAERVRRQRYALNDEQVKPYFELGRVRNGAFYTANKLFGITFHPVRDVPVWNPDVEVYEVRDRDGGFLALFMADYYARDSKNGGAWMNTYRNASDVDRPIRPIVTNNLNLIKPGEGEPTLLSFDEARTLFHEFGHALQGMLTTVDYERFSGTSGLPRDYVELCSQVMEHWAAEPEVLRVYAWHYQTGKVIPDELINKITASATFNQGFMTTEYIAASLLDLGWHNMTAEQAGAVIDARQFEADVLDSYGLLPEIEPRYRSPYFAHIFSGGYSAGYYAYLWAETLDADAFMAFKERGDIFDPALAARFRTYIFESGGREEPDVLYRKFRGRDPEIEPLLRFRGLLPEPEVSEGAIRE
jgi:peptidyl-dipeptidase Dcp